MPRKVERRRGMRRMRQLLLPELLSLRPPAGLLCNRRPSTLLQSSLGRQVVDSASWHRSKLSKYELQDLFDVFCRLKAPYRSFGRGS